MRVRRNGPVLGERGRRNGLVLAVCACLAFAALGGCTTKRYWGGSSAGGGNTKPKIGLVTKTDSNPYFIAMRSAAQTEAKKKGAELTALAGKFDGDSEGQVTAIENLIGQGVNTILVTPSTGAGEVDALQRARDSGIMVLALDSTTEPRSAADATFATDNVEAGRKQGKYLRATLGKGKDPKVLMINGTAGSTVDNQRHRGFLQGFGLQKGSPEVLGEQSTNAEQNKAQQGMENLLSRSTDINVVYNMNESIARGTYTALKGRGLAKKIAFGAIDGGCGGVKAVQQGRYDVDVMQFPAEMAKLGIDAGVQYARTGKKPKGFHDTGSAAIAKTPVDGVPTKDPAWGAKHCWEDSEQ